MLLLGFRNTHAVSETAFTMGILTLLFPFYTYEIEVQRG